jgi:hypothetical protein
MNSNPKDFSAESKAKFAARLDLLKQKKKAAIAVEAAVSAEQGGIALFIPGLNSNTSAMPNRLAESSLFAPIAKVAASARTFHRNAVLVSRRNTQITYTGEQLNEEDADIFCQLTALATCSDLDQPVVIERSKFLKSIGRATGKEQYDWLNERIKAFTAATLYIKITSPDGKTSKNIGSEESLHLIDKYKLNEDGKYTFSLDKRWAELYGNNEFSLWDKSARMDIGRNQTLAKHFQRLVATSSDQKQTYSLQFLKDRAQYKGRMRDFRTSVDSALLELIRVGVIKSRDYKQSVKTGEDMVVWHKAEKKGIANA